VCQSTGRRARLVGGRPTWPRRFQSVGATSFYLQAIVPTGIGLLRVVTLFRQPPHQASPPLKSPQYSGGILCDFTTLCDRRRGEHRRDVEISTLSRWRASQNLHMQETCSRRHSMSEWEHPLARPSPPWCAVIVPKQTDKDNRFLSSSPDLCTL
jgi:hypothetical protein